VKYIQRNSDNICEKSEINCASSYRWYS